MLLICGGPSFERNISLNSARSVYDHLEDEFDIEIVFISKKLNIFSISSESLYSNTTSDFEFKLKTEGNEISEDEFLEKIRSHDIILPIMHGVFAEDGHIQKILESQGASFIGSNSDVCNMIYNKKNADTFLRENNYFTVPKLFIDNVKDIDKIEDFFKINNLKESIVKPIEGGSSFGVKHAKSLSECISYSLEMVSSGRKILIEKRCIGKEFTVIILQNNKLEPVALIPTEIEVKDSDNIIFDTRRKYLSTNETHYYCPPRFLKEEINKIRENAEHLFKLSGAKDFLRIDGWLLDDGNIYFSDFNPISGMEQNSFIFQQSSKIGMTHKDVLKYIINSCAIRNKIIIKSSKNKNNIKEKTKKINVIFGGITAEREVSLLSGSNVWLKLVKKDAFDVSAFLLFKEDNKEDFSVLKLPYYMVLNHTVEEIIHQFKYNSYDFCDDANDIRSKLGLERIDFEKPICMSFEEFIESCKNDDSYLFLALHGGFGENGEIQDILEKNKIKFNGSGKEASRICMNKFETGGIVNSLKIDNVRSANKLVFSLSDIINSNITWEEIVNSLGNKILVKPNCDGSSSGVIVLDDKNDFLSYIELLKLNNEVIKRNYFSNQNNTINLGNTSEILFEEFIETDDITIEDGKIEYIKKTGWVELTVGVLEKNGVYHSLNPSITITNNGSVLSLEEKFQGGTGVNITPPPDFIIDKNFLKKIKDSVETVSQKIGIKDYCRIDIFANSITKEVIIIEINTLPALTPSTVIFQQAAKEKMSPLDLILKILKL